MRVLVISFYYPPLQTIAAERLGSMVRYLRKKGHEVYVLTRFYDTQQQRGDNMLVGFDESEELKTNYVNIDNTLYVRYRKKNKYKTISGLLPPGIKGRYQLSKTDVHHYGWFEDGLKAVNDVWKDITFDRIYSSYGPPAALMLGDTLRKQMNIPHIIEFRDAYIDERDAGWIRKGKSVNQQRLLRGASGLVFSSDGMKDYFQKHFSFRNPTSVVYNGIETNNAGYDTADQLIVDECLALKQKYKIVLLHTGTLYKGQDIGFFLSSASPEDAVVVFLGLSKNEEINFQGNVTTVFLPKVSKSTSLYLQKNVSALLFPVWKNRYTGFSGKLLEYLTSGTPVICSPDPQADLIPFFEASGNVYVMNSKTEWDTMLENLRTGFIKGSPVKNLVYFDRNYWLEKLEKFIQEAAS